MNYKSARQVMIESQIRTGNVTDGNVIGAFAETPREVFVPAKHSTLAYCDRLIEISPSRFLMDPMALARLIQSLDINSDAMVMVIGTGSGYSAALLSKIGGTIVALDNDEGLLKQAEENFKQLQVETIVTVKGSLHEGFPKHAPYDAILLDGAAEYIPQAWLDQLTEQGRLAAIINKKGVGKATLIEKRGAHFSHKELFDAWVPTLPGLQKNEGFVFA